VSADHKELLVALDNIRDYETTLGDLYESKKEEEYGAGLAELRRRVDALVDLCLPHLEEEERDMGAALENHFTPEEEGVIVQQIAKSLGISGARMMVPWIVDSMERWAGLKYTNAFVATLPAPLRMALKNQWRSEYELNNMGLLKSIRQESNSYKPSREACCAFWCW